MKSLKTTPGVQTSSPIIFAINLNTILSNKLTSLKLVNKKLGIALCSTVLFLSVGIMPAFSQKTQTLYIGYGNESHLDVASSLEDIGGAIASFGLIKPQNRKSSGVFFVGYRSFVSKSIEIGGTLAFQPAKFEYEQPGSTTIGNGSSNTYALLVDAKYNYIVASKLKLYSGLGAGVGFKRHKAISTDFKQQETLFAFQVDAIGASFDLNNGAESSIAPFINLGYGYKGFVNAGIQLAF